MFIRTFVVIIGFLPSLMAQQNEPNKSINIALGLEQDMLPYILKGYIGTAWIGRNMERVRFSYAVAAAPKFTLNKDIESDVVNAFGISYEYFFKENFNGFWFGPGIGVWTNDVIAKDQQRIIHQSFVFSLGSGYNYPIGKRFYLSPWLALHSRVAGNKPVPVGSTVYKPMIFTPELSVKLGIRVFEN